MTLLMWGGVFVASLIGLIKGADWVLESARKIGLAIGLSPFVVGVVIVGFGTSTPELASSIFGVLRGAAEVPVANAIGSNIANILIIVGITALVARGALVITKDVIDIEIPLFLITTVYFFATAFDGVITRMESFFLLAGFCVYLAYTLFHKEETPKKVRRHVTKKEVRAPVYFLDYVLLLAGFALLIVGAHFTIESVVHLSDILRIPVGVVTLLAVAIGTSLPELVVSVKAAFAQDYDLAIGNIFGSNIYNILVVVGIPGLLTTLTIDTSTLTIALPTLIAVSVIFAISCLSRRIHVWEGVFYLLMYTLFVVKLFGLA